MDRGDIREPAARRDDCEGRPWAAAQEKHSGVDLGRIKLLLGVGVDVKEDPASGIGIVYQSVESGDHVVRINMRVVRQQRTEITEPRLAIDRDVTAWQQQRCKPLEGRVLEHVAQSVIGAEVGIRRAQRCGRGRRGSRRELPSLGFGVRRTDAAGQ